MANVEQLVPPFPRTRFSFWGDTATIVLPEGSTDVSLEYIGDPPHGDPLYLAKVDRITVGGWKDPLPVFGRDLHVSGCARFLAFTSFHPTAESAFHVVDLSRRKLWSAPGFVRLEAVSSSSVTFRRYVPVGSNAEVGEVETVGFELPDWSSLAPGID